MASPPKLPAEQDTLQGSDTHALTHFSVRDSVPPPQSQYSVWNEALKLSDLALISRPGLRTVKEDCYEHSLVD
jgi:hypothetical protein